MSYFIHAKAFLTASVNIIICNFERTEKETDRQTKRHRQRQRQTDRQTETETETESALILRPRPHYAG